MFTLKAKLKNTPIHNFMAHLPRYRSSSLPVPPSPSHLCVVADKCTTMRQLKQIHAQMVLIACINDNYALSRLLSFCALSESGDLRYALKLFDGNRQDPNPFMWNTLIRAQADTSNPCDGLFLYVKMRRLGFAPNKYTFPFLLKACAQTRSLWPCKQVHTHALKFGLQPDVHVANRLLRAYSLYNQMGDAAQVLDECSQRDLTVWTTIICGYAQNFLSNEALMMFDAMLDEGFQPRAVTLSSVLSACARSGCLELGERIHRFIDDKGVEVGVILGSALVHMYARNGAIAVARKVFDGMLERNSATWNAMICGLAAHGHAEEALGFFQRSREERVTPNDITFVGVLSACCHAGLVDVGRRHFHLMRTVHGIEPKLEHYSCMVDLLGRKGMVEEAEKLVSGMSWKADVVILGALLTACKSHGNIEIAERVVKRMDAVDRRNHGGYVVLSNMYAEAGRWDDATRLRRAMRRGKLVTRGWSFVDDDDGLQAPEPCEH